MREAAFDNAIADFLQRETPHIAEYAEKSSSLLPYRQNDSE
jgi:predicted N-acyltransferase